MRQNFTSSFSPCLFSLFFGICFLVVRLWETFFCFQPQPSDQTSKKMRALLRSATSLVSRPTLTSTLPSISTVTPPPFTSLPSRPLTTTATRSFNTRSVGEAALSSFDDNDFETSTDLDRAFLDRAVRLCRLAGTSEGLGDIVPVVPGEELVSNDVNPFELVSGDMRRLNGQSNVCSSLLLLFVCCLFDTSACISFVFFFFFLF